MRDYFRPLPSSCLRALGPINFGSGWKCIDCTSIYFIAKYFNDEYSYWILPLSNLYLKIILFYNIDFPTDAYNEYLNFTSRNFVMILTHIFRSYQLNSWYSQTRYLWTNFEDSLTLVNFNSNPIYWLALSSTFLPSSKTKETACTSKTATLYIPRWLPVRMPTNGTSQQRKSFRPDCAVNRACLFINFHANKL